VSIDRVINGTAYPRNDFVRLIAATVGTITRENNVGANVQEIVDHWDDPDWKTPEPKRLLAIELSKLSDGRKSPVLHKVEGHRGRYVVAESYLRYGLTVAESIERALLPDMIANGGFMTYTAIRESFGVDPRKVSPKALVEVRKQRGGKKAMLTEKEREDRRYYSEDQAPDYNLRARIAECTLIHRAPRGRNLFQLHGDLLSMIPLEGRHVEKLVWQTMAGFARRTQKPFDLRELIDARDEEISALFLNVGQAYKAARTYLGLELEEVAEDIGTSRYVSRLAHGHPARSAWEEFVETRQPDAKWTPKSLRPKAFYVKRWSTPEDWPAVTLALFEEGDHLTHQRARTDFHRALCRLYDTDPVAMSRGLLVRQPQPLPGANPLLRLFVQDTKREAPVGGDKTGATSPALSLPME